MVFNHLLNGMILHVKACLGEGLGKAKDVEVVLVEVGFS